MRVKCTVCGVHLTMERRVATANAPSVPAICISLCHCPPSVASLPASAPFHAPPACALQVKPFQELPCEAKEGEQRVLLAAPRSCPQAGDAAGAQRWVLRCPGCAARRTEA